MEGLPKVNGVSHRLVRAGRIEMHVAEAGDGPPLLLVHGWPQHWYAWRKLIPELAKDYRVICPDLRGLGWSDAPAGPYDKETLADDLLNLLDALGLRRVAYVGHDWGGWAGYLLALRAPERIERLAMVSIPTPGRTRPRANPLLPLYVSYQFVAAAPVLGQLVQIAGAHAVRAFFRTNSRVDLGELDVYTRRFRESERAQATTGYYRTFLLRELPRLGRYRGRRPLMPLLRVVGADDALYKGLDSEWDVVIPDAGHFVPEEAPRPLLKVLRPFLNGEEPPRGGFSRSRHSRTATRSA